MKCIEFAAAALAACCLTVGAGADAPASPPGPPLSLTLIPPSPVTDQIALDVRVAVRNATTAAESFAVAVYLDGEQPQQRLREQQVPVDAGAAAGFKFLWPTRGAAGKHRVILVAQSGGKAVRLEQPLEILASDVRSTRRLGGAWVDICHHDPQWGRPFIEDLRAMTDAQWRELVRAMHAADQNLLVITMMFQNFTHRGRHHIPAEGYHGKAYYPSRLYPDRMTTGAEDPLETILSEADALGMHVMPGVGTYAFFDYTPDSLAWHKRVASELWDRYGRHPSFYGWYVSEEGDGGLGHRDELLAFFREFTPFVRRLAPDKPVMLARNSYFLRGTEPAYRQLLPLLDILGVFCFHRLPRPTVAQDLTGEQAAAMLQAVCDEAGCHLWMDLESFTMTDQTLLPRPVEGLIADLTRFTTFEKVLHYEFPGMMSAPSMSRQPGGPASVKLYTDYMRYLEEGYRPDLAKGKPVALATAYAPERSGGGTNALTDGFSASEDLYHFAWQGYRATNLDAVVDLGQSTPIRTVYADFLHDARSAVYWPAQVEYAVSDDGRTFSPVGTLSYPAPPQLGPLPRVFRLDPAGVSARYVRLRAANVGRVPEGRPGAGQPAWIFVDELVVK